MRERNRLRLPNPRRTVDAKELREVLARRHDVTQQELADMACVPREKWRRFERSEHATIPDTVVKVVTYECALELLECTEEDYGRDGVTKLLGGDFTIQALRDFLHAAWQEFDPKART